MSCTLSGLGGCRCQRKITCQRYVSPTSARKCAWHESNHSTCQLNQYNGRNRLLRPQTLDALLRLDLISLPFIKVFTGNLYVKGANIKPYALTPSSSGSEIAVSSVESSAQTKLCILVGKTGKPRSNNL